MEKIDLLLAVMLGGFGLVLSLMIVMWNSLNKRFDRVEVRIERLSEDSHCIHNRVCRIEGAFASKDCCMIKDSNQLRKTE